MNNETMELIEDLIDWVGYRMYLLRITPEAIVVSTIGGVVIAASF